MIKKLLYVLSGLIFSFCHGAWAASQGEWLSQIERYMNASKTLEAVFEQMNPNGSLYRGKLFLQRPGKMRLIYTYPKKQNLIADGKWLIIQDQENEELTTLALKETPAEFFLRDTVSFSQDVTVQDFEEDARKIKVSVVRTSDPEAGSLILSFAKTPFQLIQWIIIDANGLKTIVNLQEIKRGVTLDPRLFVFEHPDLLP